VLDPTRANTNKLRFAQRRVTGKRFAISGEGKLLQIRCAEERSFTVLRVSHRFFATQPKNLPSCEWLFLFMYISPVPAKT
jgi:hypothetical protein